MRVPNHQFQAGTGQDARMRRLPHVNPTIIDLFAGAGGMTEGFRRAGFTPILAVEMDADAAATYRANLGDHVVAEPIESVLSERFPEADVVIGGPPCQGFSPLGRMSGNRVNGKLNRLWRDFARVLRRVVPDVFVLENVPQLRRSAEFRDLKHLAERLDYQVHVEVLNAADFGVPQKRRRAIVIGSRVGTPRFPQIRLNEASNVRDAIAHLPEPIGHGEALAPGRLSEGMDLHFNRRPHPQSIERYRLIPPGGNRFDLMTRAPHLTPRCWLEKPSGSTDVFGRLLWNEPSLTVRTEFFKPEKGRYLHPEQQRPISHLEASLLQTFPEDYAWSGSKISVARQIGNAVPVRFAEAIALSVAVMLDQGARQSTVASPE